MTADGSPSGQDRANPPATNRIDAATGRWIQGIRSASFPELANTEIRIREFHSRSDYFRTRFSILRFLFVMPMRYFVEVNPQIAGKHAPPDGICAIVAHELVHVATLSRGNRIRRLGLLRLLSAGRNAEFERGADLQTIARGYGEGLKSFRAWVYRNVPPDKMAQKRRNYFSPEEISLIEKRLQVQPELFQFWVRHIPTSVAEILNSPR